MAVDAVSAAGQSAMESMESLTRKKNVLDQDAFLKLLVAQLTYQDPMNPVSNGDFSAQMAQFSALEQMVAMNKNIGAMYVEQSVVEAAGMIGKTVYGTDTAGQQAGGSVSGVSISGGIPYLELDTGAFVSLYNVTRIEPVTQQGA